MFDVFCGVSGSLHVPGNLLCHTGDIIRSKGPFLHAVPQIQLEIRRNSPRSSRECKVARKTAALSLITVHVIFSQGICMCVCNNAHIFLRHLRSDYRTLPRISVRRVQELRGGSAKVKW